MNKQHYPWWGYIKAIVRAYPGRAEKIQGYEGVIMARNKYPGLCYCCGQWIEPGYGHFERVHNAKPGQPK